MNRGDGGGEGCEGSFSDIHCDNGVSEETRK